MWLQMSESPSLTLSKSPLCLCFALLCLFRSPTAAVITKVSSRTVLAIEAGSAPGCVSPKDKCYHLHMEGSWSGSLGLLEPQNSHSIFTTFCRSHQVTRWPKIKEVENRLQFSMGEVAINSWLFSVYCITLGQEPHS